MPRSNRIPFLVLSMFVLAACLSSRASAQCGDAYTTAAPAPNQPVRHVWSPYSKDFDLVWDLGNEDWNCLPLNPEWGYQLKHRRTPLDAKARPNFQNTCGPAFYYNTGSTSSGNNSVHADILASDCTSQHTFLDVSKSSLVGDIGGYCTGLINGHLTWRIATYTGMISWDGWSGDFSLNDGDYNFLLQPSDIPPGKIFDNGFTNLNWAPGPDGEYGIGLEFKDSETVSRMGGPWWQELVNGAQHNGQPSPDQMLTQGAGANSGGTGLYGVVTGVIGIDGVHGGYTEVHPVFAMALNTEMTQGSETNSLRQTWVYFLRNRGNGGGCSSHFYPWPTPPDKTFWIQLPALKAASSLSNALTSNWTMLPTNTRIVGNPQAWPWQSEETHVSILRTAVGVTLIAVRLPKISDAGVDGQFTVEYDFPRGAYLPPLPGVYYGGAVGGHSSGRKEGPRRAKDDSFNLTELTSRISDPAARAKFTSDLEGIFKQSEIHPAKKFEPIEVDIVGKVDSRVAGAASRGGPAIVEPSVDLDQEKLNEAIKKLMDTYKVRMRTNTRSE